MNQYKLPISVTALKAEGYSTNGNNIIISITVRFLRTERKYSVPVECFYGLIASLQTLNAPKSAKSIDTSIHRSN
jgi:hypothetical protein